MKLLFTVNVNHKHTFSHVMPHLDERISGMWACTHGQGNTPAPIKRTEHASGSSSLSGTVFSNQPPPFPPSSPCSAPNGEQGEKCGYLPEKPGDQRPEPSQHLPFYARHQGGPPAQQKRQELYRHDSPQASGPLPQGALPWFP